MAPDVIHFYSVTDEHGWCSNFAPYPIRLGGRTWPTTEHYFQARKFEDPRHQEAVRRARTPLLAARLGRDRRHKPRRDWESIKVAVMREALRAKFTQHEELARRLLATGEARLVEHTEHDDFWGDGGDGRGKNMLGRLLMEVRQALRLQGAP